MSSLKPVNNRSEELADISGKYSDRGTPVSDTGKPARDVSLSDLLHVKAASGARLTNTDAVVITGPKQETIQVQALCNGEQIGSRMLAKLSSKSVFDDYYEWRKGYVKITTIGAAGVSPLVSGGAEESLHLAKAEDGSLVALQASKGFWLVGNVVPVWRNRMMWYRFAPVVDNKGTNSASMGMAPGTLAPQDTAP